MKQQAAILPPQRCLAESWRRGLRLPRVSLTLPRRQIVEAMQVAGVAEWLKAAVCQTVIGSKALPGVRIPPFRESRHLSAGPVRRPADALRPGLGCRKPPELISRIANLGHDTATRGCAREAEASAVRAQTGEDPREQQQHGQVACGPTPNVEHSLMVHPTFASRRGASIVFRTLRA